MKTESGTVGHSVKQASHCPAPGAAAVPRGLLLGQPGCTEVDGVGRTSMSPKITHTGSFRSTGDCSHLSPSVALSYFGIKNNIFRVSIVAQRCPPPYVEQGKVNGTEGNS